MRMENDDILGQRRRRRHRMRAHLVDYGPILIRRVQQHALLYRCRLLLLCGLRPPIFAFLTEERGSPMETLDHIIDRLEVRRMSVARLTCIWCPCCLRVATKDPAVRGSFDLIWSGEDNCRQLIKTGPISECISDLRALHETAPRAPEAPTGQDEDSQRRQVQSEPQEPVGAHR